MGDTMNKDEYQKMVKEFTPKENKIKKAFISFLVGGSLGFASEVVVNILVNSYYRFCSFNNLFGTGL